MKNLDHPGGRRARRGRWDRRGAISAGALLATALLFTLCAPAAAIEHAYTEDFTSRRYCDVANTTALWDTTAGRIGLNPYPLAVVGSYNTPGYAYDVVLDGDYAFVADRGSGLRVLSITNPSLPTNLGVYDTPGLARGVAVSGDLAFVADDDSLLVVNIQSPTTPARKGACKTPGHAWRVAFAGDCVFVADDLYGMQVIGISDPAHPSVIGSYSTPGNSNDVVVWGDRAYLAGSFGLRVVDISDPAHPQFEGALVTSGNAWGITVAGDKAYLAGQFGLLVVDVSDPAAPRALGGCPAAGDAMDVTVTGDWAYVSDYNQQLHLVDITDADAPVLTETLGLPGYAWGVAVAGTRAYVACGSSGMAVADIAQRWPLLDVGFCELSSRGIAIAGDWAYTLQLGGFSTLDLRDPCNPIVTGSMALASAFDVGLVVDGSYAYVAADEGGLQVVDVSDPSAPLLAASRRTPAWARGVTIAGDRLYVTANGLEVFDVTDPVAPDSVGYWGNNDHYGYGVAVAGDRAFVGNGNAGFQVLNILNPVPTLLGTYLTPGGAHAHGVVLAGDRAFVADWGSLQVINIANPSAPSLAGSFAQSGYDAGIALAGDLAFYTSYDRRPSIRVLDISNPASPSLLETSDHMCGPVALSGDFAYLVQQDWDDGIRIMQFLQRRFDTALAHDTVRSLPRQATEDPVLRARLTTTQQDAIVWEASADNGASWASLEPLGQWRALPEPGTDLVWRSRHSYVGDGDPVCTSLKLEWLYQFACIDSIADVRRDQGGWARVYFTRSGLDFADEASEPILSYLVYRRTAAGKGLAAKAVATDLPPGTWELVGTVPAFQSDRYLCLVPTLEDSAETFDPTVYCIAAQTTGHTVYYSYPDSGYSVDNIPPVAPEGLAVAYAPGENALSWQAGADLDLIGYRIYRGESDDFALGPETLVHATELTGWQDQVAEGWRYRYKVTALDQVGNESDPASPQTTTGVAAPGLPTALALHGGSPNPFNPTTTIAFGLPAAMRVRLTVYDAKGRLVRTLVDAEAGPGRQQAVWDGRDATGRGVPSGTYICRLEAPGFHAARKLTLIR